MFIDRAVVEVRSGKGGDGAIAFLREKFIAFGGPSGGNGGKGASIFFRASSKINTLFNFRHSKTFIGKDGENGGPKNQYGHYSEDVIIDVPIGTVVYEEDGHKFLADLSEEGKIVCAAKGGRGGRGNNSFKSSTNRAPKIAENGEPGEKKRIILELKLLADVGIIGFPSVGKSTFLSIVSAAKPEIADYPFTTIVPNLGVVNYKNNKDFVIADLPGLIEGAHLGKGLGLQFLRHVERCRIIIHMIDMSENGRNAYEDYKVINNEIKSYGFGLENRPVILVASKMDEDGAQEKIEFLKSKIKQPIISLSALTNDGVDEILDKCVSLLDVTPKFPLYSKEETTIDYRQYSLENEEPEFLIKRIDAHTWQIYGNKIEKFYKMTNISTDEGLLVLMNKLRKIKVEDMLEKLGAVDGDTVVLLDFTFEYLR